MLYIDEEKVKQLLTWTKTLEAVELAMARVSQRRAFQNARAFTRVLKTHNLLLSMPGYLEDDEVGALGTKLVTVFPNNVNLEKPLSTINANILLFDNITGLMKVVVAATTITTWRTAAASVVATKNIHSNTSKSSKNQVLAVLGAGVQGEIHAEMFNYFFCYQEIRIWNRTAEKAKKLAVKLNAKYNTNRFKSLDSNEDTVRGADVIVTATFASSPIVNYDWVKHGAHINAVGAGQNHHSELDEKLYLNSDVYIDHWEGARMELAGLEKLGVKFKGEVGAVVAGSLSPDDPYRITVFQSLGMAVEDCAVAKVVHDLYIKDKTE